MRAQPPIFCNKTISNMYSNLKQFFKSKFVHVEKSKNIYNFTIWCIVFVKKVTDKMKRVCTNRNKIKFSSFL